MDFGCGPGRFTPDLANLIHGSAVGIDISARLIAIAPKASNVRYGLVSDGLINADGIKFDVIWICLVLGGIPDDVINSTAKELERTLNPGGLLFLVENTSRKVSAQYWIFRSVEQYQALFQSIDLGYIGSYSDVGEEISIIAGRKKP
ncbi:MAG: class I SAM-dependent methyltransferase [Dechloromonas sp.]|nr:MAG: class I SAM-dependent methyltransferase [Dechloromonas sp.]